MKKIISSITAFLFITVLNTVYAQKTAWHILKTFHIASSGGWDYLAVGPLNKLYVSHGTQVNILNKETGDSLGVIENTTGVHGIAFDKNNGKGYTSNGRLNNVFVFDLSSGKVITQIGTGENPDAILYEPFSKKIITCNGRSKDLSVIDPSTNKVIVTIPVGGKPETAVSNNEGKLYVNIEDKSEIVEVETKNFTVLHHWTVAPGEEPTGLAIDIKTHRLFAGCGNKQLIVMNAENGKIIAHPAIGDGCDGVAFDSNTKNIFASNGEGTLSIYNEETADQYNLVATVPTKKGARTIAVDEETHKIYLPTAEFEPTPATSVTEPKTRPKMKEGTFQVLVIGQ